ncbi:MAG: D-2-hydroxyacid dehydrogenase [Fibrobacterota bacterium]
MNIVVLDGYALNPGDLSWDGLKALGDFTVYDRTPPALTMERAADAEIVLTNKTVLPRSVIAQLPRLRYIGVLATGYNVVDAVAAREQGVVVTNVPAYGTDSVSQTVFAHLLNLSMRVGHHADTVRAGRWTSAPDFCYWDTPLVELSGLTLGIVGFGRIGRAVAKIARAFNMRVLAFNPSPIKDAVDFQITTVDMETLFRESDAITLHCPLTESNKGFVNTPLLSTMKSTAFLINTSRGPLIDEAALANALNTDKLAGAGLDVLSQEPPSADNPLLSVKNCFVTPHYAWATRAARQRLMNATVGNVAAFLLGKSLNVVN